VPNTATTETYDGIILGAGHNSLVLQAYLGKSGLKTVCIDRLDIPGGALTTLEDRHRPGFLHNTHSFYHRALNQMPWYHDLELERRGAVYLEPELNAALILKSGQSLQWWTDFDKTAQSFAQFSQNDAATLRRWRDGFLPIVQKILIPESRSPPIPAERRRALLERSTEGRRLLEASALSPLEFVQREFESPVIRAGLLFFNGLREVDLRCRGFGHHIAALLASSGKAQMCVGGSRALAKALTSAVEDAGGEILLSTAPRKILVEHGRAVGVETTDGAIFRARHFIASGLNPRQTFLDLIDSDLLPSDWLDKARRFKFNLIAPLFALNLNLREPPRYAGAEKDLELANAFMVILGLDHDAQYADIVRHHEAGTLPPTVMWGTCPTLFDPTQAPPGRHTAFMWEKLPYRLRGDATHWDTARENHARDMLALWTTYAPNLKDAILHSFARSPLDTERSFPNMHEGDLLVGAFTHGQIGHDRPFPGAGHYRAHLEHLYLCGSSSHPGGNITGLPGYNCAQTILADLGIPAPWQPPNIDTRLEQL
jgi:phytoene dehydrogenase-like protein